MSERTIQRILAGEYWVYWTYGAEEWQRYAQGSWDESKHATYKTFGGAMLFAGAASLILGLILGQFGFILLLIACIEGLIMTLGVWIIWLDYSAYRRRLQQTPSYVYISKLGIYRPEGYHSLNGLSEVQIQYHRLVFSLPSTVSDGKKTTFDLEVLIPEGQKEEAQQLVQQIHQWLPEKG